MSRLQYLSERTGRSKTFYATEALTQYLDENADYLLTKDALEEFTQSDDDVIDIASEEMERSCPGEGSAISVGKILTGVRLLPRRHRRDGLMAAIERNLTI